MSRAGVHVPAWQSESRARAEPFAEGAAMVEPEHHVRPHCVSCDTGQRADFIQHFRNQCGAECQVMRCDPDGYACVGFHYGFYGG